MKIFRFILLCVVALIGVVAACEEYQEPPHVVIVGLTSGVLDDPRAPITIDFGMSIDPATLSAKIALLDTDVEGNLLDEDDNPDSQLRVLVRRDLLDGDLGAKAELLADNRLLKLTLESALPVGPKLVLVVEAGLKSAAGTTLNVRKRVPFSYVVKCAQGESKFPSGTYFFLLDVEQPLGTQIQLLAYIDVDPKTGALVGQFSNADRNPEQKCPSGCASSDVCRLLPAPECVLPSTRAGTINEYPDFIPNPTPPVGYSFLVQGCAVDDGNASGVLTAPATMVVESPAVTVEGLTMTSSFAAGPDGIVRATGSLTADVVRLGTNPLGPGRGAMTAVRLPDDRVPPNVPRPAVSATAADGGAGDASR